MRIALKKWCLLIISCASLGAVAFGEKDWTSRTSSTLDMQYPKKKGRGLLKFIKIISISKLWSPKIQTWFGIVASTLRILRYVLSRKTHPWFLWDLAKIQWGGAAYQAHCFSGNNWLFWTSKARIEKVADEVIAPTATPFMWQTPHTLAPSTTL